MLVVAFLLISLRTYNCYQVYTDQFVIQVPEGTEVAKNLANKHGFHYLGHVFDDYYHIQHRKVAKRSYKPSYEHHITLEQEPKVSWYSQQKSKRRVKRDYKLKHEVQSVNLSDPRWPQMWYLNRGLGLDMNVQNAWINGITGKGIVVTILDDGLEKDHPDLIANYDPQASFDVNNHDPDPQPRYDFLNSNRHGTRCGGEVAASANNSICAVGIAYNAGIGGVKMLDGDVTDVVEARSLGLNPQHIDIYSASWGPDDDGKTVDGPGELATQAFTDGIKKGRNGLGSIFVWASGNGGREKDNCNCDGYTNSIWTLSISSATENGLVPWYSEACSSTLATTYSSGSAGEKQIVTTDLRHECTSGHTGTSASAPLAAAICALALEANPKLTWRDMQHIVVRTAQPANLFAKDWAVNGVNRNVSHSFGYGMMDAAAMVTLAKKWISVPPQKFCEVRAQMTEKMIFPKSYITVSLKVQCENVHYLEHVQAKISLTAGRRGDMFIFLTSPSGTKSRLLDKRPYDNSRSGFQTWPFMTVHCWGENPNGVWKLEVHNDGHYLSRASIKEWSLLLYGTTVNPDKHRQSSVPSSRSTPTIRDSGNVFEQSTVLPFHDKSESDEVTFKKTTEDAYYPLGCKRNEYVLDNHCVAKCPISHTNITVNDGSALCVPCHYSCLSCTGLNDYQCSSCHGDSVLTDNYCMPKLLFNNLAIVKRWYVAMTVAFVIVCILTLLIFGYIFCYRSKTFYNHNSGYVSVQKIDPTSITTYQDSDDEA